MKNVPSNVLEHILCPPGNGVYTVHAGAEYRQKLHQQLFQTSDEKLVRQRWQEEVARALKLEATTPVLLGIPSDNGGGIQRGANWGPLYLRSKLMELFPDDYPADLGDVRVIPHFLQDESLSDNQLKKSRQALFGDSALELPVSPLSIAMSVADHFYRQCPKGVLIGLGGDHSVSYPLVKSFLRHHKERTAILHFDAHTDLLPERLGVPVCFGSWAFHILNDLATPRDLIQIGIRSSGKDRQHWENNLQVRQYWASELLSADGPINCGQNILQYLKDQKISQVYVSFDIDALDARYASATGTPEPHGPGPHQLMEVLEQVMPHVRLAGADLVEVAPHVAGETSVASGRDITLTHGALFIRKFIDWSLGRV